MFGGRRKKEEQSPSSEKEEDRNPNKNKNNHNLSNKPDSKQSTKQTPEKKSTRLRSLTKSLTEISNKAPKKGLELEDLEIDTAGPHTSYNSNSFLSTRDSLPPPRTDKGKEGEKAVHEERKSRGASSMFSSFFQSLPPPTKPKQSTAAPIDKNMFNLRGANDSKARSLDITEATSTQPPPTWNGVGAASDQNKNLPNPPQNTRSHSFSNHLDQSVTDILTPQPTDKPASLSQETLLQPQISPHSISKPLARDPAPSKLSTSPPPPPSKPLTPPPSKPLTPPSSPLSPSPRNEPEKNEWPQKLPTTPTTVATPLLKSPNGVQTGSWLRASSQTRSSSSRSDAPLFTIDSPSNHLALHKSKAKHSALLPKAQSQKKAAWPPHGAKAEQLRDFASNNSGKRTTDRKNRVTITIPSKTPPQSSPSNPTLNPPQIIKKKRSFSCPELTVWERSLLASYIVPPAQAAPVEDEEEEDEEKKEKRAVRRLENRLSHIVTGFNPKKKQDSFVSIPPLLHSSSLQSIQATDEEKGYTFEDPTKQPIDVIATPLQRGSAVPTYPELNSVTLKGILRLIQFESDWEGYDHFLNVLILTHSYWIPTCELLQAVCAEMRKLCDQVAPKSQLSEDSKSKAQKSLTLFVNFIRRWQSKFRLDFNTKEIKDEFEQIFTLIKLNLPDEIPSLSVALHTDLYSERKKTATMLAPPVSTKLLAQLGKNNNNNNNNNNTSKPRTKMDLQLLQIKPLELARQLTLADHAIFNQIKISEYHDPGGDTKQGQQQMEWSKSHANLNCFCKRNESITYWIASEIVLETHLNRRVATLAHFIETAKFLLHLKNFSTLMAFFLGLSLSPIEKLTQTWKLLPRGALHTWKAIQEIMSPHRNFQKYRELVSKCSPPLIPIPQLFMKDIIFVEENTTWLTVTNSDQKVVNWQKMNLVGKFFYNLKECSGIPYPLTEIPQIQEFLSHLTILDQKEISLKARLLEMKGEASGTLKLKKFWTKH